MTETQIMIVVMGVLLSVLLTLLITMVKSVKGSLSKLWEKFDEFPHVYVTQGFCDRRHDDVNRRVDNNKAKKS